MLDGSIDWLGVEVLLGSRGAVTSVREELAEGLQGRVSGQMPTARRFVGQARLRTPFGRKREFKMHTVLFTLTLNTLWGMTKPELTFIVLPEKRNQSIPERQALMKIL